MENMTIISQEKDQKKWRKNDGRKIETTIDIEIYESGRTCTSKLVVETRENNCIISRNWQVFGILRET